MSKEAEDFISKLLEKNPSKRLGSNGGIVEILSHPWFANLKPE
jgi:serum/glucocorticoid-regulated kinase 2